MPRLVGEILARPWAVALTVVAAFLAPLLLADLAGGGGSVRPIAEVTTTAGDGAADRAPAIPDLRPAPALPRMRTTEAEPPAAEAVPPAAAVPEPTVTTGATPGDTG